MIVYAFGLLDILAGTLLVLSRFWHSDKILIAAGILLLIKSLVFFCGIVSTVDAIGAAMIMLIGTGYYAPHAIITFGFALWFLQKGFLSFLPT